MIRAENIEFGYYKDSTVLKGVSVELEKGEIVNILGPNGCGKSTLLKLLLGLLKPSKGKVTLNNEDILRLDRGNISKFLSYVPQFHNAIFPYKVLDVVLMGRSRGNFWKRYSKEDYIAARRSLELLNVPHLEEKVYSSISGGERQLVMIARAMAQEASFCFMDEPVASLDYGNQYRLLEAVKMLSKRGVTFVITTHHPDHAYYLSGRAIMMKSGVIYADGKVDEVINKKSLYDLYGIEVDENRKVVGVK